MTRPLNLDTLKLSFGSHDEDEDEGEMCVMEAVAYIAGEPWSDHPHCVSPVIAAFCRAWNDTQEPYGAEIRDRLRHYIPRLIGTRGDAAQEERRSWLALDWLIRVQTATWLRVAGLTEHAETLINLPPQTSPEALHAGTAARAAAGDAAWAAARDAAWAATWAAAGAAARAATWAAARDAARAALKTTVEELQTSAWQLLDAMLAVE